MYLSQNSKGIFYTVTISGVLRWRDSTKNENSFARILTKFSEPLRDFNLYIDNLGTLVRFSYTSVGSYKL